MKAVNKKLFFVLIIVAIMITILVSVTLNPSLSPFSSLGKSSEGLNEISEDVKDGVLRGTGPTMCYVCDVSSLLPSTFTGCYGDADGNGVVNAGDRGFVAVNIGQTENDLVCKFDMDGNGFINAGDRGFVATNIGLCEPLPDYQNGNGVNGWVYDQRFDSLSCCGNRVCEESNGENSENCLVDCDNSQPVCGNGEIEGNEQCEGSNLNSQTCTSLELGYSGGELGCYPEGVIGECNFDFSGCNNCGDGITQTEDGEECDDGNFVNGDGCSASCTDEGAGICGNDFCDTGETIESCALDCAARLVGFIPGIGETLDVEIRDVGDSRYAYMASREFGLSVIDVTNPVDPAIIRTLGPENIPTSSDHVALGDGIAVIGSPSQYISIFDISDPLAVPEIMNTIELAATDIYVLGNYGYAVSLVNGLVIFELTSGNIISQTPEIIGTSLEVVQIDGADYAFITGGAPEMKVVSLNNLAAPQLIASPQLSNGATGTRIAIGRVSGQVSQVYVSADTMIYAFDVSSPQNPLEIGSFSVGSLMRDLDASGNYLIVITSGNIVKILDVSNPSSIIRLGERSNTVTAFAVDVREGYLFIASGNAGLNVMDARIPASPVLVSNENIYPSNRDSIDSGGGRILVGSLQDYTRLISIDNDIQLTQEPSVEYTAKGLAVDGSLGYIANALGVKVVNLETGEIVREILSTANSVTVAEIGGRKYLFVGTNSDIKILDISSEPVVLDVSLPLSPGVKEIEIYSSPNGQTYAYVALNNYPNVKIYEVSNPTQSSYVGELNVQENGLALRSITLAGNVLAVVPSSPSTSRLKLFDLTSPGNPIPRNSISSFYSQDIVGRGNRIYSAYGAGGLEIIDVSNFEINSVQTVGTPGVIRSVAIDGDYVYLGDSSAIVSVVEIRD